MRTKYFGITYDKERKKYKACIWHRGKNLFLGRFDNPEDAARVYDKKAKELRGIFTPLNFSDYSRATKFQLKCYKLCSPDFAELTQHQAAKILKCNQSVICEALKKLKEKLPELFPIYFKKPDTQRFEDWMNNQVVVKI